jgi:hypothetical protein
MVGLGLGCILAEWVKIEKNRIEGVNYGKQFDKAAGGIP